MLPFRDCLHVHTSAGWFGKAEGNARLEVTSSAVMSFGEVGISPSAGIWALQHPALQHVGEAGLLILFPLSVFMLEFITPRWLHRFRPPYTVLKCALLPGWEV